MGLSHQEGPLILFQYLMGVLQPVVRVYLGLSHQEGPLILFQYLMGVHGLQPVVRACLGL